MRTFSFFLCLLLFSSNAWSREWVSSDGKKLDAEFVSFADGKVTIKRSSDGREFTLPLSKLSEADRKWVEENANSEPPAAAPKAIEGPYAKLLTGNWELSEYRGLPFAIYGSADLDGSKKYPLVLGLHGKSQNNENGKQKGILSDFAKPDRYAKTPAVLVAPLCYQPFGGTGGGWGDKPGKQAIKLVEELAKELPIVDEKRLYVLGSSMGGGGTASLISAEPRLFAAGIVICGWPDSGSGSAFKKVPVWAFHGSADTVVRPDSMRKLADSLKRSKIFKYTEFEGAGHNIKRQVFSDPAVFEWLFAQRRK